MVKYCHGWWAEVELYALAFIELSVGFRCLYIGVEAAEERRTNGEGRGERGRRGE